MTNLKTNYDNNYRRVKKTKRLLNGNKGYFITTDDRQYVNEFIIFWLKGVKKMKNLVLWCAKLFFCLFLLMPNYAKADNQNRLVDKIKQQLSPPNHSVHEKSFIIESGPSPSVIFGADGEYRLSFALNSSDISNHGYETLHALGRALQDSELNKYIYKIEGHTCKLGDDTYNLSLSRKRAEKVKDYLIGKFDFPPGMFEVVGYGESHPISASDDVKNRRVEIINTLKIFPVVKVRVKYLSDGAREQDLIENTILTDNDRYYVELNPQTEAHVYIYQIDSKGESKAIFPNPDISELDNPLSKGLIYRIPGEMRWLKPDDNNGEENIIVVANKTPIPKPDLECRRIFESNKPNVKASSSHSKGVHGVRNPLPVGSSVKQEEYQDPKFNAENYYHWRLSFINQ